MKQFLRKATCVAAFGVIVIPFYCDCVASGMSYHLFVHPDPIYAMLETPKSDDDLSRQTSEGFVGVPTSTMVASSSAPIGPRWM
jgi:hypothetical protein